MANNPFEIPQSLRDASVQNLNQAHAAYDQLLNFVTQAVDGWVGALPANPLTAGFKAVQGQAIEFAKENAEKAFGFAGKIGAAQSLQEVLTLQTQFAQEMMQTFVAQIQQIFSALQTSVQKSDFNGAFSSAGVSPIPSNLLLPTGFSSADFKPVQEQAVALAKKNADAAFSLIDKISHAQNFQDIFTIQTHFAQEQIQAFAAQTQEIQKLMGSALQKIQQQA